MANEIVTELVLELNKFKAGLDDASKQAKIAGDKSGNSLGQGFESGFSKAASSLLKTIAVIGGGLLAAFSIKKAIEQASQQEDAINAINAALAASGNFTRQASLDFQAYAAQLQSVTTVADDVILKNAALLASLGGLSGEGLKKATKAALDLAAGLNIDVASAFNLVAKAADGNVGVLSRYGIRVAATGDKTMDFARALEIMNHKFGGLAESKVNTFSGALAQMENTFSDLLKEFGRFVTQSPLLIGVFKMISSGIVDAVNGIKSAGTADVIGNLSRELNSFALSIVPKVLPPLELLINMLTSLSFVLVGMAVSRAQLVHGKFAEAFDTIKQAITDAGETVFDFSGTMKVEEFLQKTDEFVNSFATNLNEMGPAMASATSAVMSQLAGITFSGVLASMSDAKNKIVVTSNEIAKHLNGAFVGAISSSFAALGGALATGKNGFAEFGKSVLKSLGGLLMYFGQMLIAIGLGLSTVPFLFGFQGPAAVIAGIAATVLGGALQALGGGGGAPAGAGSSSGGGITSSSGGNISPGSVETGALLETEKKEPTTTVHVNVQGNILDRRETGLAIADIINETFGSNGITFATT